MGYPMAGCHGTGRKKQRSAQGCNCAAIEWFELPMRGKVQPKEGISMATSGRYFGEGWV
jgi:hypothetical protein